jgi:methylglutamate dehydrogenase subunit D
MSRPPLESRSAFASLSFESAPGRGVHATDRSGVAVVKLLARKGRVAELRQRVQAEYGVELPQGPRRAAGRRAAFVGIGVDAWLALGGSGAAEFATDVQAALGATASVSDQGGAYGLLRLSGPRVADTLAKMLPIDLHPRVFDIGFAASTAASHIAVCLWRLEDDADALPVFEIAVARSFAASFWHALTESAAEFGFALSPG